MEDRYIECHKKLMELSWRVIGKSRCNLSSLGFAWNQYSIMKALEPGESLTVSEISTRVHRKISNVTPVVDFLEERGIAERVSDEKDRRVIRVRLTKEGINIRQKTIENHNNFLNGLYQSLTEEEMEKFLDVVAIFLDKVR
ncbi:MAG: MarR family winged helix-turn-helix transcriptional regulator [Caldicoprobacterales bacterium]|jgi:DNA-binding MarR family transcriptional regulator|nr:MarR family transcriptional regulator [Clostridiales bacterium]